MSVRTTHTVRPILTEHLEAFLPFQSVQPFFEQKVRQFLHHAARIRVGVSRRCSSSTRDSGYFHLLYRCG
jgi:hypothetical protein